MPWSVKYIFGIQVYLQNISVKFEYRGCDFMSAKTHVCFAFNQKALMVIIAGRKYGYVKYASAESARRAVEVLHGQMVCGNRMKVMIAEKPRYPEPASKRDFPRDFDVDVEPVSKRAA